MTLTNEGLIEALKAEVLRLRRDRDVARNALAEFTTGSLTRVIVFKIAAWVNARPAHVHPRELARMIRQGFWK